jgi:hypothetical protein
VGVGVGVEDLPGGVRAHRRLGRLADPERQNALPGRFAWADVDWPWTPERQAAWEEVRTVAPGSMLVDSGRGRHCYVPLGAPHPPAELEVWNRRLGALLGADSKWAENSLLRLPGTLNFKPVWQSGPEPGDGPGEPHRAQRERGPW